MGERLDKFLASQGLGTRKAAPPSGTPAPKSSPAPTG